MTTIQRNIEQLSEAGGADFFGIADLSPAHDAIIAQGGPMLTDYPRAISIGIALLHTIVDQLPRRDNRAVAVQYRHHTYDVINLRLDLIASQISSALQKSGYNALPIPASQRVDDERICAVFSHKLAAHLAGLGWIGKSCLLVTPTHGPRVRWATVLTNAPFKATGKPMNERCGSCKQCVEICPVQAFTGKPFRTIDPREVRYDASKCDRYFSDMKSRDPERAVCGLCLYVCPHGQRQFSRKKNP